MEETIQTTNSEVEVRDFYGVVARFPVIETGKAPAGYGHGKVKVVYLNSQNEKEVSVVNHNHIGLSDKRIQEIKDRVRAKNIS